MGADDLFSGTLWSSQSPVAALVAQVNRFGPAAPAGYQFVTQPFQLASGILDPALALAAITIYQRRATAGYEQFHDAGSETAIARANVGFADPLRFVTDNLPEVTAAIGGYADSLGLPAAAGSAAAVAEALTSPLVIVAGIALVLWLGSR